jgi:hypothetical protein
MRTKKKVDYGSISRRSVRQDFYPEKIHVPKEKAPQKRNFPEISGRVNPAEKPFRIQSITPVCQYEKFSRFFVGKLVQLAVKTGVGDSTTGWYEFVFEDDRKALNEAAGWSDNKRKYLLERPKLK